MYTYTQKRTLTNTQTCVNVYICFIHIYARLSAHLCTHTQTHTYKNRTLRFGQERKNSFLEPKIGSGKTALKLAS